MHHLGTLLLEMHSVVWIWHFEVHVFVYEACGVSVVVGVVVCVHVVVPLKVSSVEVFGFEVEPDIIVMRWVDLVERGMGVDEVFRKRQRQVTRL